MKQYLQKIGILAKTDTAKDAGVVFFGQIISTIFSAVFFLIIARFLGPALLGIYSAVTAIVLMLTDTLDLAINSTIVKFIGAQEDKSYLKFAFLLKILLGFLLFLILYFASPLIALLLHQPIQSSLQVASILVFAIFMYRFPKSVLQGEKKFVRDVFLEILLSLARLGIVILLIWQNRLTINGIFWAHIIATSIAFLVAMTQISPDFVYHNLKKVKFRKFFSFHGYLSLGFILAAVHSRLDNLFLIELGSPAMVGFYQAGYRFFMPVIQFSSVLSTVFAPRFSSFQTEKETKKYLKKTFLLVAALSGCLLVFIPFIPVVIKIFYGASYLPAGLPTQILALGFIGFVLGVPFVSSLLYGLGKTNYYAWLNLLQLLLIVILDLSLIPKFGAGGAACAQAITLWVINSLFAAVVLRKYKII